MKTKLTFVLLILFISSSAQAIPLRLNATAITDRTSDFFIDFNDNGDGLLEHGEITFFRGFATGVTNSTFWNQIGYVPTIMSISVMSGFNPGAPSDYWVFAASGNHPMIGGFPPNELWSYNIIGGTTTSVPEPTTMTLLGFGLLGIGWARRKANK